jgi:hypothetical protein
MIGTSGAQIGSADLLWHDRRPGFEDELGELRRIEALDVDVAPVARSHRALLERLRSNLEQQLLVSLLELQDDAAFPVQREGLLADIEPGVTFVDDLVSARQGEAQPAKVRERRNVTLPRRTPGRR